MDILHQGADFSSDPFASLTSRVSGDGGLNIGGLVFAQDLSSFSGRPMEAILSSLAGGRGPDAENVGGPAIVSLIHTAQLVPDSHVEFFGTTGTDRTGQSLRDVLSRTPVGTGHLRTLDGATPATHVFNDPKYDNGAGERLFINQLGVADSQAAGELPEEFVEADIVQLGGTALVPPLHRRLPGVLRRSREAGAFTVVNTVYDFRGERERPDERWTLGSDEAYEHIDVLICDLEEARRLTGASDAASAVAWFLKRGCRGAIVTCGADPVWYGTEKAGEPLIVSQPVYREFASDQSPTAGDTTGCGDNFCGGVVAAVAGHLQSGADHIDLAEAVTTGIASGAFCLSYLGGTMVEQHPGEKLSRISATAGAYLERYGRKKSVDMPLERE